VVDREANSRKGETHIKTLVICHDGAALDQEELARWLASFSELAPGEAASFATG
jgi:hypothetical protein